jgi:aminoacrylate hydrolase
LARRFTVILHDHRGTGRPASSGWTYSIEQMAGDVLAHHGTSGLGRAHSSQFHGGGHRPGPGARPAGTIERLV